MSSRMSSTLHERRPLCKTGTAGQTEDLRSDFHDFSEALGLFDITFGSSTGLPRTTAKVPEPIATGKGEPQVAHHGRGGPGAFMEHHGTTTKACLQRGAHRGDHADGYNAAEYEEARHHIGGRCDPA